MVQTSIKDAIKAFEAKSQCVAAESEKVLLYGQLPPIVKMDNTLGTLKMCKHLALSSNCIEKITGLKGLGGCPSPTPHPAANPARRPIPLLPGPWQAWSGRSFHLLRRRILQPPSMGPSLPAMLRGSGIPPWNLQLSFSEQPSVHTADNLEVLSVGRNQIKKLEGLDDVAGTLQANPASPHHLGGNTGAK